jgi:hypothetical protein
LNATVAGGIQQTFDTIAGTQYEVKFDVAGNPGGDPTIKQVRIQVGSNFMDEMFDITGHSLTNMGWSERTFLFTATTTSSTLQFTSLISGSNGPALDNVRVTALTTPIPEPHTALLLGVGLVSLLGYRWRQHRNSARHKGSQLSSIPLGTGQKRLA